jgi:tRNA(His) 5'-end guanylyltransferase
MKRHDFEILGDKHKKYEAATETFLMPGLPIVARLDGRGFSKFTRGLQRPFDQQFVECMSEVTKQLVKEFHADVGYTQSDEITIAFSNQDLDNESLFSGRVQKLVSIFAATASVHLNKQIWRLPAKQQSMSPIFDCRVYQYPNLQLAAESCLWREMDATRNSLTMATQHYYSHRECHGAGFSRKHDMLHEKGVNWNNYPRHFKRGTYFAVNSVERVLTPEELAKIPEKFRPTGPVIRSVCSELDLEPAESYSLEEYTKLLFPKVSNAT